MKKIICLFLTFVLINALIAVPTNAETVNNAWNMDEIVQYYDDGSYLTISAPIIAVSNFSRATLTTIEANRYVEYTNSSGENEWKYTLTATFSYIYGSAVVCTDSDYDYTIYDDSWNFSDGSTTRSGGTAYGYGTFKNKFLFVTTQTVEIDLSITCDVYGNLS